MIPADENGYCCDVYPASHIGSFSISCIQHIHLYAVNRVTNVCAVFQRDFVMLFQSYVGNKVMHISHRIIKRGTKEQKLYENQQEQPCLGETPSC